MSLIDVILKLNGSKNYQVWGASSSNNPTTGSKTKTYVCISNIYAVIQETGTRKNVNGLNLEATQNEGDIKKSDLVMYSKNKRNLKERILFQNLYYDIRGIESFDNGLLKYYKSYLVKVDNQ